MTEQDFYDLEFNEDELKMVFGKWKGLGFLENSVNKRNDSLAFEFSAIWLFNNVGRYKTDLETLLFPVIYRIIKQYDEDLPTYVIKTLVLELVDTFPINKYMAIRNTEEDLQAKFLKDYCENYPPLIY